MNIVFNYFTHLSFLFGYCATGLELLLIIFVLMTFLIRSQRSFLGFATIGILFDVLLASIASYAMAPPIHNLKNIPLTVNEMWAHYTLFNFYTFIFMIFYICVRLYIYSVMTDNNPWDGAPIFIHVVYIVQYLFPYIIAPMIFINSGVLAIWDSFNFLSKISIWPFGYWINSEQ
jgi:hypothetical protein